MLMCFSMPWEPDDPKEVLFTENGTKTWAVPSRLRFSGVVGSVVVSIGLDLPPATSKRGRVAPGLLRLFSTADCCAGWGKLSRVQKEGPSGALCKGDA